VYSWSILLSVIWGTLICPHILLWNYISHLHIAPLDGSMKNHSFVLDFKEMIKNPLMFWLNMWMQICSGSPGWVSVLRPPHHHRWRHFRHGPDQRSHCKCKNGRGGEHTVFLHLNRLGFIWICYKKVYSAVLKNVPPHKNAK